MCGNQVPFDAESSETNLDRLEERVYAGDPGPGPGYTNGIKLIEAERVRQIAEEGYDVYHDDAHTNHELVCAAVSYAMGHTQFWPDDWEWKPKDRLTNLIRAGALLAAEIDRELRADPGPDRVGGYEPMAMVRVREIEDLRERRREAVQTARELSEEVDRRGRELHDAHAAQETLRNQRDTAEGRFVGLLENASRLVELLSDAWWVEAADRVHAIKRYESGAA